MASLVRRTNHSPSHAWLAMARDPAEMCHSGIGASAQSSPRKMGVSADAAQGIFGYLYRIVRFTQIVRLWLVETPLPSQPHRPWVGRSATGLLTTAVPSSGSSRVLFSRVLHLSYNSQRRRHESDSGNPGAL